MALLEVKRRVCEGALVVSADGEIDSATVHKFTSQLDTSLELAAARPVRLIVVELENVTYFGSAALNAVADCYQRGLADGVNVRVVASRKEVVLPIKVTKLDEFLPPYPTLTDALATPALADDESY